MVRRVVSAESSAIFARSVLVASALLSSCGVRPDREASETARLAARVEIEALLSGTTASLRGLCAVSARIAFASGSGGTVLRTRDGGRSWERLPVAGADLLDFRSIVATSATRILIAAAGQPAHVFRSLDGKNFERVYEDPDPVAFFDALAHRDDEVWLFGDPVDGRFCLLRSMNFGDSFVSYGHLLPTPQPFEAGFAASGACLALDATGVPCVVTSGASHPARFLRLGTRGGRAADAVALPVASGGPGRGAFALAVHGDAIVVVGGDYLAPTDAVAVGAWSQDGGRTFAPSSGLGGYRSGVAHVVGRPGCFVAIGPTGAEITTDAGRTWARLKGLSGHAVRFAPGGIGFASGPNGALARIVLPPKGD